ncbi:CRISPR-associated helicase Cas3', partial [bacterium]|nr:CRISPR-associated helicase Cas3' [bacterium]
VPDILKKMNKMDVEFFCRMIFSALVDADFIDTASHFNPEQKENVIKPDFGDLWNKFELDQKKLTGQKTDSVNELRNEVYRACLLSADLPQGFFRLTVPTGGGKTRSGLAFALRHAMKYQLDRIIFAIPYTSIIEQTAGIYREIFGEQNILEHHSAVHVTDDEDNNDTGTSFSRYSSPNWDNPIIVTTTVQLFESLFSNKTSKCRKLHNIAKSVLILDEVQMLPYNLLEPILDVLQQLVKYYSVTVVLCTATQPEFTINKAFEKLKDIREIVSNPERLFEGLKRVDYQFKGNMSWEEIAAIMKSENQALTIVNTKKDAITLLDTLDEANSLHLSTLMCGMHRRKTLDEVKKRLKYGEPCHLVSTQVVEAGVDIDFPLVMRAMGPLDRIVQSAGRCNREGSLIDDIGNLILGKTLIFNPIDCSMPMGSYKSGSEIARMLIGQLKDCEYLEAPDIFRKYFSLLFQNLDTDCQKIQNLRENFCYKQVAERFKVIDDWSIPVVVRYPKHKDIVDDLLREVRKAIEYNYFNKNHWRKLQPYIVNIPGYQQTAFERDFLIIPIIPGGLYEWNGIYDPIKGVMAKGIDPENLIV